MIDFTNSIQKNKAYAGANGGKIAVVYNNEQYMLKFPPYPTKNKDMSYTNSCISEYIGCKIFELLTCSYVLFVIRTLMLCVILIYYVIISAVRII